MGQNVQFRQVLPVVIGALLGVSFGTMLGWPSITFPLLVDPERAPIFITWDQTALIAGFLMEGNIIGVAFSTITLLGSKTGFLASCCCQLAGWIMMFFAQDVPGIGVSRVLIGFGHGFGLGQLRMYAQETCEPKVFQSFMQYLPLSINVGVLITYLIGGFLDFRVLSLVCAAIPLLAMFLFAVVPKTAYKKEPEQPTPTITTVFQEKGSLDTNKDEEGHHNILDNSEQTDIGFIKAFKDRKIRNCIFLLVFLVSIPQYSGGAVNIVYAQIVHIAALNPYPKLSSIIYGFVFLFSSIIAIKYSDKFPRRPVLICSCIICSLLLCLTCLYFYFLPDILEVSSAFVWSPLFLLSIFNFFHTTGVHMIPLLFINDKVPKHAKVVVSKLYVMYFSLSAVLSTKIFQVIFTNFGMHMGYVFLAAFALGSAFIAFCFVEEPKRLHKIDRKFSGHHNQIDLSDETVNNNRENTSLECPKNDIMNNCEHIVHNINEGLSNSNNVTMTKV